MNTQPSQEPNYFATVAESYDRLQPILAGPSYNKGLDIIVDLIPFDANDTFQFVELGCGTAEPSRRVLQHFPNATGTCIDSELEMLKLAKQKLTSYGHRTQIHTSDITHCDIPPCDVVFSAKAMHHVSPTDLPTLFKRIAHSLHPSGCFIIHDAMPMPQWGPQILQQSRQCYTRHIQNAIATGLATQAEIDTRLAYKKNMKAQGKDVEYRHQANDMINTMTEAGFSEAAVVWRMFNDTIILGLK